MEYADITQMMVRGSMWRGFAKKVEDETMREYRGKRIDNGEWVKGWYALEPTKGAVILADIGDEYDGMPCLREIEVIPETVGQDTGKKLKDGTKVWEGDIVEFDVVVPIWDEEKREVKEHKPETWRRVVMYDTETYNSPRFELHWYPDKMKIIGNKWEHPELLK